MTFYWREYIYILIISAIEENKFYERAQPVKRC